MASTAIIGAQWGDEGKAKIIDRLASPAQMGVRTAGGNNAGHTVAVQDQIYQFRLIPSGILYPDVTCVLGNGTAIDPQDLLAEMRQLEERGVSLSNLRISLRAHLVMPYHKILDTLMEAARGREDLGTPRRGIGPCYMDKVERIGLRVCDLLHPDEFAHKVKENVKIKNRYITKVYGGIETVDADAVVEQYLQYGRTLKPYMADASLLVYTAIQSGQTVIFEGAQATMLDVGMGTYPYVTSSHSAAGGVCIGAGIGPAMIHHTLGVMKAYITRAGEGPFPTELFGGEAQELRDRGNEYEMSTGLARRVGWFDGVMGRLAVRANGLESIALNKLDVCANMPVVKLCTGYKKDGSAIVDFPASLEDLANCEPIYEEFEGWGKLDFCKTYEELPEAARRFVARVEEICQIPVTMIGVGPGREQTIMR